LLLLKEIGINHDSSKVSCTYTPSVKTYNIVTENMTDDSKPIQLGNGCCIWLNERGQLGEVECIYPKLFDNGDSFYSQLGELTVGVPSFVIASFNAEVFVEQIENGFIIWFSRRKKVEREVSQNGISYLLSENELLGLVAKDIEIID
jgi:hypothetical protein